MSTRLKMKLLLCLGSVLSLLAAVPTMAQSQFDGTWKIDLTESQSAGKPSVYLLQDAIYRCTTCEPKLEIRADGQDQKISGEPCYNMVSLKVIDDRTTEETDKRDGKPVGTSRMTVSPDGSTATVDWTESCNATGDMITGKDMMTRLANGPPGSHAISGTWRISKRVNRSENALVVTLKLVGDIFTFADPTGQGYTAKLDGTEAPIKGDLANTTVSVKRAAENTIEETDKRGGKIVEIDRFTISADGSTMTVSMENKIQETTRLLVAHKQ